MKKVLLVVIFVCFYVGSAYSADYSIDYGVITEVFSTKNGAIAFKLDNGFPNAVQANQCPSNNGFAGITSPSNSTIVAMILQAKATKAQVEVVTFGCEGSWIGLLNLYLK